MVGRIQVLAALVLATATACAHPTPHPPTPPPPIPQPRIVQFTVRADVDLPADLAATFGTDKPHVVPCALVPVGDTQRAVCTLDADFPIGDPAVPSQVYAGIARVAGTGLIETQRRFLINGHSAGLDDVRVEASAPPLSRIVVRGRDLAREDGQPFVWRGATEFQMLDYVADGNEAQAIATLDWMKAERFNVARVLTMMPPGGWFELSPAAAQAALPRLFNLASARGVWLELVALAGTKDGDYSIPALEQHVAAIGAACRQTSTNGCAAVELANENAHPSQRDDLDEQPTIDHFMSLLPHDMPISAGSNCCGQTDEGMVYAGGTYITVHNDRSRDTWERTRHLRELETVSAVNFMPVVGDEPIGFDEVDQPGRRSANENEAFGQGATGRVIDVAITFHYEAGLRALPPGPIAAGAARAFIAGTMIAPDDVHLTFRNAGWSGVLESPVKEFSGAVRVFSGIGRVNVAVALGTESGFTVRMTDGWIRGATLVNRPGVQVFEVHR